MPTVVHNILDMALAVAPWLVLGLLAAGLVKGLVVATTLTRWLGGRGPWVIARAAVIGAPLPLCSCGAIPTALALYRGGAGRGPSTAFLIGTPGIGIDSLAVTYALLGPLMAVVRAASAVVTAISTGVLVATTERSEALPRTTATSACQGGCGSSQPLPAVTPPPAPLGARLAAGLRYAFTEVLDDISIWIVLGLVFAGVLMTFLPPDQFAAYGSGLVAMLLMAVIGIPLYLCASAATPIGESLLLAGVSPGTVLVLLLAAPITSLATLGVLRREMGNQALLYYVAGIFVTTVSLGLAVDAGVAALGVDVGTQVGAAREWLPESLAWACLILLLILGIAPLRRRIVAGRRWWQNSPTVKQGQAGRDNSV